MAKQSTTKYNPVDATPVKSFFVSMLTRDIKLEDAILDLLDNCVDGILRSKETSGDTPYKGFWAEIEFKSDMFSISDNCGGIPWSLHDYAFRMGRTHDYEPDVTGNIGIFGIGMKRAIFKIGRECMISTRNGEDRYEVEMPESWFDNEEEWSLPVRHAKKALETEGTTILIGQLNPGIAEQFGEGALSFKGELDRIVSTTYGYIIEKGFSVKINGDLVKPRTTKLVFDSHASEKSPGIRPYVFKTKWNGVDVFLTVGFTRPIPSQSEILDEQESKRYSSMDAGWTVLCNDRAVLYADRNEITGWGEAGVPRYHTQFIAIAGIVEFCSDDARKLPTTTTKRGIDGNSPLYLQVKNKMREGMRIFTDYTNKWKGREDEAKSHTLKGPRLSLLEIKGEAARLSFTTSRASFPPGEIYKPKPPLPARLEPTKRRVSFVKELAKITKVAEYFGDEEMQPSDVGEKCFDTIYDEARK